MNSVSHHVATDLNQRLVEASKNGNTEEVANLLNQGADTTYADSDALQWAVINRHTEIIKMLLDKGAKPGDNGSNALNWVNNIIAEYKVIRELLRFGIISKYLTNKDVDDTNESEILVAAAKNRDIDAVKLIISMDRNSYHLIDKNRQVFDIAIENGDVEMVKYLDSIYHLSKNDRGNVIENASKYGYIDIIEYFIGQGAPTHNINYAVGVAAYYGHLDVIKYLVSQGADIHYGDDFALRSATKNNQSDIVEYLTSQP